MYPIELEKSVNQIAAECKAQAFIRGSGPHFVQVLGYVQIKFSRILALSRQASQQ
jgi:hypothetical protein